MTYTTFPQCRLNRRESIRIPHVCREHTKTNRGDKIALTKIHKRDPRSYFIIPFIAK
jgi:hypothetical protein